jgi:putative ABC transport system permease protein
MEVSLRYAPGTDRADVARRLDDAYPAGVTDESPPSVPGPLVTLRETDGLVRALGAFLTFLMLALTANALLAGVRNRAPDLAILRSLGFSSRETNRSILWMSTTTVGLGLVVGIPLGLVLGAAVWRRVAGTLDIGSDMAAPWWFLAVLTVTMLVAAAVLALIPGRRAARLRPVEVLRAE